MIYTIGLISWKSDPPNFHTGAPGELTCNTCHIPPSQTLGGSLDISGLPDTILPNTTYEITVSLTKIGLEFNTGGFQMTLIKENLLKTGIFSDPSIGAKISESVSRNYFEHNPAGIFNTNTLEWKVNWRSPDDDSTSSQTIHIYANGLLANGNDSIDNDLTIQYHKTFFYKSSYRPISANFSTTNLKCNQDTSGRIELTANGGKPPYKFIWSNGDTTSTIDHLAAGTYAVTITDQGIGNLIASATVTQPFPVFGEIIKVDIPCNSGVSGEATVVPSQGVQPYTFLWSTGSTENSTTVSNPGPIYVTITDQNNCTFVAADFILNKGQFNSTITSITNSSCHGGATGSATVTPGIPFVAQILWSNGDIGPTADSLAKGTYEVTVTSVDGCESKTSVEILEPSQINLKTNQKINPSCFGSENGLIALYADGGVPPYNYLWEDGSSDKTRSFLGAGDYVIQVQDAFNCKIIDTVSLINPDIMAIQLDYLNETEPGKADGKATVIITGGNTPYRYKWSNGSTIKDQENLAPGWYEVTVTDAKGCSVQSDMFIFNAECNLEIKSIDKQNIQCGGDFTGFIHLEIGEGIEPYTISWSNGSDTSSIDELGAGIYHATISDADGCTVNAHVTLTQPPQLLRGFIVTDVPFNGSSDGKIKVNISGGRLPYYVSVNNDLIKTYSGVVEVDGLSNGLHTLIIRDGNGCEISEFFVVNILGCQLSAENPVIQQVKCHGDSTGAICINVKNNQGNYSLAWDDESSDLCRLNLPAGLFSVHVSDDSGCQYLDTFEVKQPPLLEYNIVTIDSPTVNQSNGKISLQILGGTLPYNIKWYYNGNLLSQNTSILDQIGPGEYFALIVDANDCEILTDTIVLTEKTSAKLSLEPGKIQIWPNPSSHFITITCTDFIRSFEIKSLDGTSMGLYTVNRQKIESVDVRNLPSGIYILQAITNKGILVKKWIKI